MIKKVKNIKFPSELRFDLISRDWVVIATGRARRPETFKREERREEVPSKKDCPFCQISTQKKPTLIFNRGKKLSLDRGIPKDWSTIVVPNKYPAFIPYAKLEPRREGEFYQKMNAAGFHEVVVTRDHKDSLGQFKVKEVKEVFDAIKRDIWI